MKDLAEKADYTCVITGRRRVYIRNPKDKRVYYWALTYDHVVPSAKQTMYQVFGASVIFKL